MITIPEELKQFCGNRWNIELHNKWITEYKTATNPHCSKCPECGKKTKRHILALNVYSSFLNEDLTVPNKAFGDAKVVYVKKNLNNSSPPIVGLWDGFYLSHSYGKFCKLRCCERYANRCC